jgi:hypothetical protein
MARKDGFTSKQVDDLSQFVQGVAAFLQSFSRSDPEIAAKVDATAQAVAEWADS